MLHDSEQKRKRRRKFKVPHHFVIKSGSTKRSSTKTTTEQYQRYTHINIAEESNTKYTIHIKMNRNDPEFQSSQDAGSAYDVGSKGEVNGAAVAGGIAGVLLGGPLLGVMAAAGTAYLAASKRGDAGDWARKSGKAVTNVGKSVVKIEKENKILDRTSKELVKGAKWVDKQFSSTKSNPTRDTEANLTS